MDCAIPSLGKEEEGVIAHRFLFYSSSRVSDGSGYRLVAKALWRMSVQRGPQGNAHINN